MFKIRSVCTHRHVYHSITTVPYYCILYLIQHSSTVLLYVQYCVVVQQHHTESTPQQRESYYTTKNTHHKIQKIQYNTFKGIQDVMSNHFDFLIAMSLNFLILTVVTTHRTQISLSPIKHLGTIEIMAMRNRTAHRLKPQESPDPIYKPEASRI